MRIGLLVEGVCPGFNKFIHTLVQKSENVIVGFSNGWEGLYCDESHFIDTRMTAGFENFGGSILPSSFLKDIPKDWKYKIMQNLLKYKIDLLLVVGNEYSLDLLNELFSAGVRVILIPSADFGLNIGSYKMGLNTILNKLSECMYYFKNFSKTSGRKTVLCLSQRFRDHVIQMKNVHNFFMNEVSDQIFISWDGHYDCIVKIDGILSASKPLKKDLSFAEDLAKMLLSHSSLRGGSMLVYDEDFEFLTLQSFRNTGVIKRGEIMT